MNISAVEYWGPGGDDSYTELSDEPFQEGPTGGRHGHLLTGFELIWFRHNGGDECTNKIFSFVS